MDLPGGRFSCVQLPVPELSALPLCVLRSLVNRRAWCPSKQGQTALHKLLWNAPEVSGCCRGHTLQPWRKVGESWQPSELLHQEVFFPCLDDFSVAWRKFLQTFHLPRFASELGTNTGNFSTEERMAGNFRVLGCRSLTVTDQPRCRGLQVLALCRQA